jgi:hypothetical protein
MIMGKKKDNIFSLDYLRDKADRQRKNGKFKKAKKTDKKADKMERRLDGSGWSGPFPI